MGWNTIGDVARRGGPIKKNKKGGNFILNASVYAQSSSRKKRRGVLGARGALWPFAWVSWPPRGGGLGGAKPRVAPASPPGEFSPRRTQCKRRVPPPALKQRETPPGSPRSGGGVSGPQKPGPGPPPKATTASGRGAGVHVNPKPPPISPNPKKTKN